ncbi:MAG: DMT family transporter [Desulfovibrionaceae bacterium]
MTPASVKALLPENARSKGRLAALTGGLLLSFDAVFVRLSGVGAADTAFLFGLFSALSMALLIQLTDRRGLAGVLAAGGAPLLASALLMTGSATCFVLSVKHTAVANTVFILSARPIFTAAAAWLFLRERTPRALWLAIAGVTGGIFLVVNGSLAAGNVLGDGFAVLGVTCLGLNGTLWRRYKAMSRLAVVGLGGLCIALVMFIPASPAAYAPRTWLVMAAMGMLSAPLGRALNAVSTRYIPAAEMATMAIISAVLAPAWAFLFFAERPPASSVAGGAVIFAAIAAYVLATGRAPARQGASAPAGPGR